MTDTWPDAWRDQHSMPGPVQPRSDDNMPALRSVDTFAPPGLNGAANGDADDEDSAADSVEDSDADSDEDSNEDSVAGDDADDDADDNAGDSDNNAGDGADDNAGRAAFLGRSYRYHPLPTATHRRGRRGGKLQGGRPMSGRTTFRETPYWAVQWDLRVKDLRDFVAEFHCMPRARATFRGRNIGNWVSSQRQARNIMCKERIAILESVPCWTWVVDRGSVSPLHWDVMYNRLTDYVSKHAALPSPVYGECSLGSWTYRMQRSQRLSAEQRELLEKIPCWSYARRTIMSPIARWSDMLKALREAMAAVGKMPLNVEMSAVLAKWVSTQRKMFRENRLLPSQIADLTALPHWTWVSARHV